MSAGGRDQFQSTLASCFHATTTGLSMKSTSGMIVVDKKAHICPPSNATHPSNRWESLFVYAFICKFTKLRGKVEGLETPMDFEAALLLPVPNTIMTQILTRFILNLRPQTRNLSSDIIATTVASVLQEYLKSNERTVFWNDEWKMNLDPFQGLDDGGFWSSDWDFKLKVLRQFVELQLVHSNEIKALIDRAWGVIHNKHKKHETTPAPPPPEDPFSMENLLLVPLGQDSQRKRYWVIDDSPRVYMSTNPWKITAAFEAVCSTRDEYVALIERLKSRAPPEPKNGQRRSKPEQAHTALLKVLQDRIAIIDADIARVQKVRRKIEQKQILMAQAEVRETRTRRRTTRPDYAYLNNPDSEDEQDEYNPEQDYNDPLDDDYSGFQVEDPSGSHLIGEGRRRSTRASKANGGTTPIEEFGEWRGERRSARLGAPPETQLDGPPPAKRARTVDSTASTSSNDGTVNALPPSETKRIKIKIKGAARIKDSETVVETVAGKKRSRFWYYAVEPIPGSAAPGVAPAANVRPSSDSSNGNGPEPSSSGQENGTDMVTEDEQWSGYGTNEDAYQASEGRSASPGSSMNET